MNAGTWRHAGWLRLASVIGAGLWGLSLAACSSDSDADHAAGSASGGRRGGSSEAGSAGDEAGGDSGSEGGAAAAAGTLGSTRTTDGGAAGEAPGKAGSNTAGTPGTAGAGSSNECPVGPSTDQGVALCGDCDSTYCCTEIQACSAQTDCQLLQTCLLRCEATDRPCVNACSNLYPAGVTNYNNLTNCASFECSQACSSHEGKRTNL